MDELASRVESLKPSATLTITSKAKAMRAAGIDVVNLSAGEPDFDTPQHIKDAAWEAIKEGFTKYTAVGGIDELKDAIIEKFKRDNGAHYKREEIIVSCGGKHVIYNLAQALFEHGDEVIIPSPYWVSYPPIVTLANAAPVIIPASPENGFKISAKELSKAITSRTKALIINSPSNPTGAVYKREELEEIAGMAIERGIYLISDEIYENFIYDGIKSASLASLGDEVKNKTIVVNGVSKAYSMTGWRIGYAAGPEKIISAMTRIQSQSTSNPNSIAQKASIEALRGSQAGVDMMVKEFDVRRRRTVELLNKIEGIQCAMPEGAFYAFPNIEGFFNKSYDGKVISSAVQLAAFLLEKGEVAVVPGDAFGAPGNVRISYASSIKDIEKGIDRMEKALSMLKS